MKYFSRSGVASKMKSLLAAVCGILLAISSQSVGQNLEVLIDDVTSTRDTFCVGERLTFVCTISGDSFSWRVDGVRITSIITSDRSIDDPPYRFTAATGRSTMEVEVSMALNNSNILCVDASGNNSQMKTVQLFTLEPPSSPNVTISEHYDFISFNLNVTQPGASQVCVTHYNITVEADSSITVRVPATIPTSSYNTQEIFGRDFTRCSFNYTFSVIAITRDGTSSEIMTINNVPVDLSQLGSPNATKMSNEVVLVHIPRRLSDCIVGYAYNFEGQRGKFNGVTTMVSLGMFDIMNCTNCTLELSPLVKVQNEPLFSSGFDVDVTYNNIPEITTMVTTPSMTTMTTGEGPRNTLPIIVGSTVGGLALIVIIIIVIIILVLFCIPKIRHASQLKKANASDGDDVRESNPVDYDPVNHDKNLLPEQGPTYQAPDSIQRQPAGPTGDMYTVPANLKSKSSKKAKAEPELPMYSVVDKTKKKDEAAGLVYADIDVKNPVSHRSKRPPPPPGVTEQDANEPVVYSTVH